MKELIGRVRERVTRLRAGHPWLDHVLRTQEHYSASGASQQAGAVTYFGFLSVFPILALAFFAVGWISKVYPQARTDLTDAINAVLPGLVGQGAGQVSLADIESAAGAAGIIGAVALLYAGLGWVSALRTAVVTVFCVPKEAQPNWLIGKLRDVGTLLALGLILGGSVAVTGWLPGGVVVQVVSGLAVDTVLCWVIFRVLAAPDLSLRTLWSAAAIAGVGFEVLKQLSKLVLTHTTGTPAFQAFGVSLVMLVWINYFTRLILYAASWAVTSMSAGQGSRQG